MEGRETENGKEERRTLAREDHVARSPGELVVPGVVVALGGNKATGVGLKGRDLTWEEY